MGYEGPAIKDLIDGDALRHALTALARQTSDQARLRAAALAEIKSAFQDGRARVRAAVDDGRLNGLQAARALSALQDVTIQVLYDFATKHFYYAQNPTASERIAVVATGGYGRGELAPGSLPECIRLSKQDITIRTALLEARYLWGDRKLYDELRKKFWSEVATGTGQDFVEAKLAERDERHARQGESRYLVEPNIKEGKGGLRDLQTLYWIGKYVYHVEDAADLVQHAVFTKDEYKTLQKADAFLWDVRVRLHYLAGRAEERLSFDVQPELAARMGFTGD